MALHLEIVTPKGAVLGVDTEKVYLPGKQGEFGVLDGHIPFLSALRPGVVTYTGAEGQKRLAIGAGFAEVGAGDKVLVLTDVHSFPEEVDVQAVQSELDEAERELKEWTGKLTAEHSELRERAQWAQARLDAATERR
jgi:F-type H+-transporting ATPase subunit epsilon